MIPENVYVMGGKRHVGNRYGAMMRLDHNLVIGQFYFNVGKGSSFLEVVNRSGQRPGVGRTSTIDGHVNMFQVQCRRNKAIRITKLYIRFK